MTHGRQVCCNYDLIHGREYQRDQPIVFDAVHQFTSRLAVRLWVFNSCTVDSVLRDRRQK